jgi:Zinc-finger associated domain (zf-AD)
MDKYCRLCLKSSEKYTSVFDKHEEIVICRHIQDFFKVSISEFYKDKVNKPLLIFFILVRKDVFSKLLCENCLDILIQTLNYRKKFLQSAKQLFLEGYRKAVDSLPKISEIEFFAPETKSIAIKREIFAETDTPTQTKRRKIHDSDVDFVTETAKKALAVKKPKKLTSSKKAVAEIEENKDVSTEIEVLLEVERIAEPEKSSQPQTKSKSYVFSCLTCGEGFKRNCQLKAHHFLKHDNDFKYLHTCTICNNSFMTKTSLIYHEKIHVIDANSDKIFEDGDMDRERTCADCSMKFPTLDRLRKHWNWNHGKGK